MLKNIQWDIYNILMIALVPAMLLTAWGIESWNTGQLHKRQCEMAVDWLETNATYVNQFEQAGTTGNIQLWLNRMEPLDSPMAAGELRMGVIRSAYYHMEHLPDLPTDEPGVLNPRNGLFERQINEGTARLIAHCPETQDLIHEAFPMVFREDDA